MLQLNGLNYTAYQEFSGPALAVLVRSRFQRDGKSDLGFATTQRGLQLLQMTD